VVRNRVRRRLRAAVARHEDLLVTGGYYLFSAAVAAEQLPFTELDGAVARLLGRAREARR
jgi:ribonuclease P protein component